MGMKLKEDSLANVHRGLSRENFLRKEQSGRGLQTDVGGMMEGMGRWWRGKALLESPWPLAKKEDGQAGGLTGFPS